MRKHDFSRYTDEMLIAALVRPLLRNKNGTIKIKDAVFRDAAYAEAKKRNVAVPYVD